VAVLLAGSMVLLLAPALLDMFGRWTWALPRWLAKVLPHIDIEGERAPHAPPAVPVPATTAVLAPAAPSAAKQPGRGRSSLNSLLNGRRRADSPDRGGGQ